MNPLPNIIVIDFCDWLRKKISDDGLSEFSLLDIILDRDDLRLLEMYAEQFLEQQKEDIVDCPNKLVARKFVSSKEFEDIGKECSRNCRLKGEQSGRGIEERWCYECEREFYYAYRQFIRRINRDIDGIIDIRQISHYDLAAYMRNLMNLDDVKNSPYLKYCIMESNVGLASEMDFLEWLQKSGNVPNSISKMPSELFEKIVDEYIISNGKGEKEKRKLIKAYRKTGWETLLETLQVFFIGNKSRPTKELKTIIDRYCFHRARFNCIILPLSDAESQKQYRSLITDSWYDLNELSDDYLDIYYSEADNGKSGYDIAKRINSLPNHLKKKAPCLVIWKYSIAEAKAISIEELNKKQIMSLIRCIVEEIQKTDNLDIVIKEAEKMVQNQQGINHGATIITIEGHGNVIGNNNEVKVGVVNGDNNYFSSIENRSDSENLISELEQVIKLIKDSTELDEAQKSQMCEIMQEAMDGVIENSESKKEQAKKAFNVVKSFLFKTAPKLLSVISNLTQIAEYFGI